jgi:hypothetical protein
MVNGTLAEAIASTAHQNLQLVQKPMTQQFCWEMERNALIVAQE